MGLTQLATLMAATALTVSLIALCEKAKFRSPEDQQDAMEFEITIMQMFQWSSWAQRFACANLATMLHNWPHRLDKAGAAGACEVTVNAMLFHPKDAAVQLAAAELVLLLAADYGNWTKLERADACEAIMAALTAFPGNGDLRNTCLLIAAALAAHSSVNTVKLGAALVYTPIQRLRK